MGKHSWGKETMLRSVFTALISLFFFFHVRAQSPNDPHPQPQVQPQAQAQAQAQPQPQAPCSKTCIAENCDTIGIKYGKYCGIGYTGCPGEKPCDDVDACCQIHDDCVDVKGYTQVKCHKKFKKCIKAVQESGKVGFSKDCPYDIAIPTMANGMDLAIMLSTFGNKEL